MNGAHGTQLELSILTAKSSYAAGETIALEISLRVTGSKTIKALKYLAWPADDPNKSTLEIHLNDAAGNRLTRVSHVMTGRALYYPQVQSINPGETYRESRQLSGTFVQRQGRKKVKQALWNLGENPEITSASEYPFVTPGTFKVQVIYRVDDAHLIALEEAERLSLWKGQLSSNTIELSIV